MQDLRTGPDADDCLIKGQIVEGATDFTHLASKLDSDRYSIPEFRCMTGLAYMIVRVFGLNAISVSLACFGCIPPESSQS